ncbi:MAG: transposase [Syntrophaceae bacterium]|nr:transposase [Actinomycetota bacterium]MCG2739103.1 transposase [Syntrophaceae bacterium]
MGLVIFEQNKPFIVQSLRNGEFDYMEAASEVFEADFFRFIKSRALLDELAATYPNPRKKQDVPFWFYIAGNLSMRLHGVHAFDAFPMVVRSGGMLQAFGPQAGRKTVHPETGDTTIFSEGFNQKNHYDRQTPCDQDYLRKVAKDTDAQALMRWFGEDGVRVFQRRRAFDREGIFIGDASYLFVPDNPHYEGSVKLLFDEHNHPLSEKQYRKMTDEQKSRCQRRRCYKMVTLLHTNRTLDFFLFVAVRVVSGNAHECPVLYDLVKQFVQTAGKGVMKRLILDRGFLDGKAISLCKKEYGIDVLIPIRRNMDIYVDAMALFRESDVHWVECKPPKEETKKPLRLRPKAISKREQKRQETLRQLKQQQPPPPPEEILIKKEAAAIGEFRSWDSCSVPLTVVANREHYADGHQELWFLIDTKEVQDPTKIQQEYHLRTSIEERYRQLKCFNDLTHFTSRAFSMVVNQVVFIMLAYNLLQFYLVKQGRKELNQKTLPHIRQQLLPSDNYIIVNYQNYYGLFSPFELIGFVVKLSEEARKKIAAKCERIGRELDGALNNPRPP